MLEGYAEDTPPDRAVIVFDFRGMVGCQPQFELRRKFKCLLVEKPCPDRVSACEYLDQAFSEPLALVNFNRYDEPPPREFRDVVSDGARFPPRNKCFEIGDLGIIAKGRKATAIPSG